MNIDDLTEAWRVNNVVNLEMLGALSGGQL